MPDPSRAPWDWRDIVGRIYALALMLVLLYAGCTAGIYLYGFAFHSARTPEWLMHWQQPIAVAVLRNPQRLESPSDEVRAPLDRFHRLGAMVMPDPTNSCTLAGCHSPLPHGAKSKIPAFANFHVAFLACQSCHTEITAHPTPFTWMNSENGNAQTPPQLIRLARFFDDHADDLPDHAAAYQAELLSLLSEFAALKPADHLLNDLYLQLDTSEPASPQWQTAVAQLQSIIPGDYRGNYGARLIPQSLVSNYASANADLGALARQALAAPAGSAERKRINDQIHAGIPKQTASCTMCHSSSDSVLDFQSVGYSKQRATALSNLELARLMQQIRDGKVFHLPTLVGPSPGSADAN
jgi:hypothetical protein